MRDLKRADVRVVEAKERKKREQAGRQHQNGKRGHKHDSVMLRD